MASGCSADHLCTLEGEGLHVVSEPALLPVLSSVAVNRASQALDTPKRSDGCTLFDCMLLALGYL